METVLRDLAEGLAERWEIHVAVSHDRPSRTVRERPGGIHLVRVASAGRIGPLALCPGLALHLWRGSYDCVVLHEPNPLAVMALACRAPSKRFIIWHHSDYLRPRWSKRVYDVLLRRLCRRADCVIFSSPRLAAHSEIAHLVRRVAVIPFGIDQQPFTTLDEGQRRRVQEIRAAARGPIVLAIGRLVYYKGVDVLLEAMGSCAGTLIVVGDGASAARLHGLAARGQLRDRVTFISHVSPAELVAYYHAADLFVLPSTERTEAFGLVQVEAMACGVPVISTDLPTGVPWVNQHGVTGIVVPPRDAGALARAIRTLSDDAALRVRLGEGGRRRAATEFSKDRMLRDFAALVESVVTTRGA
jgi:rhamnosyl/mannosyltransferase